jgi:hypothetical protein
MRALITLIVRQALKSPKVDRNAPVITGEYTPVDPIASVITLERFTIRHRCAVDSGMHIIKTERDMDTFSDKGDWSLWVEFKKYEKANQKAIAKEENDRYRY